MRDLPEPEWWRRAQRYHALGLTVYRIAINMGKSRTAVRNAVNPEFREKHAAYMRKRYAEKRPKGGDYDLDGKRNRARQEARERWRADGKQRKLIHYYRELGCL